MRASSIEPARIAGLRPALLPRLLRLPDWLFKLLARRMLAIDPQARSSMWDDLQRGRPTEIAEPQGAILRLAERRHVGAMVRRVTALVRQAEQEKRGSPCLKPRQISARPGETFDQNDLLARQVGTQILDIVDAVNNHVALTDWANSAWRDRGAVTSWPGRSCVCRSGWVRLPRNRQSTMKATIETTGTNSTSAAMPGLSRSCSRFTASTTFDHSEAMNAIKNMNDHMSLSVSPPAPVKDTAGRPAMATSNPRK
jgi:hypothetical protein